MPDWLKHRMTANGEMLISDWLQSMSTRPGTPYMDGRHDRQ